MIKEIRKNPIYPFLFILVLTATVGFQGWRTLFNNFAVDVVEINGFQNGIIQAVREIPGFLTFLVVFVLILIKEQHLTALSVIVMGTGIALTGFLPTFHGLIISTLIMSIGFHYFETTNQSLTLQHFSKIEAPYVFARLRSLGALSNIFLGGAIWLSSRFIPLKMNFIIIGGLAVVMGVVMFFMHEIKESEHPQHKKMIIKKKYWLFYLLNLLNGARRQIFVVFAVFMLVKKYHFTVAEISILFVINNLLTYFINPYIAKGINHFGERKVLSLEYFSLILVFLGYVYLQNRWLVALLYIVDHIFFNFAIGVRTYFQKTADPRDIAPSMAVGFAINHISAVIVPVIGGALWMFDWRIPFWAGAVLSIFSLFAVQNIKLKPGTVFYKE